MPTACSSVHQPDSLECEPIRAVTRDNKSGTRTGRIVAMNDFVLFAKSVWRHSVRELTSSAAVAALSIWEHVFGSAVRGWVFLAVTILLLGRAFYKAWRDEHRMLVAERQKAESGRLGVQNSVSPTFNPTFKQEANPSIHVHCWE